MSSTPGADPALYESDPVFVAQFNTWVRGEVDVDSAVLTPRVRQLVRLASVIGADGVPRFEVLADGALETVLTPVELKELVYQSVPLVGYATASDFLRATNDLLRRRGVELPLPDQPPVDRERPAVGAPLERYGTGYVQDVLGRGGLDLADRSLVTLSFLVALGIGAGQLEAQVRVALGLGLDREVLLAVLVALVPAVGLLRVREAWPTVEAVVAAP